MDALDPHSHTISVIWMHRRRVTPEEEGLGKQAALRALALHISPEQAAQICVETMFRRRHALFGGITIVINGENFVIRSPIPLQC